MIDFISDKEQELVALAQGLPSELEYVKRFTIGDYIRQLKYLVDKNKE